MGSTEAERLEEITRDLPAGAKPEDLYLENCTRICPEGPRWMVLSTGAAVPTHLATLMFEASISRHAGCGTKPAGGTPGGYMAFDEYWRLTLEAWYAPTRVEALAKACLARSVVRT